MPRPKNPKVDGALLRTLRKKRGWTVFELAAAAKKHGAKVSGSSVQAWELGSHGPDLERLHALAKALGVPPETLSPMLPAPILER